MTLMSYIDHHGVLVRAGAPPSELAVGVARHFEAFEVDADQVIGGFLSRPSGNGSDYVRATAVFDGIAPTLATRKRNRSKKAARPGEQVAAKITRTDENGSLILASVQRFYSDSEAYDVHDEDDPSKLIRLPWNNVMRLSTGNEGRFNKGTPIPSFIFRKLFICERSHTSLYTVSIYPLKQERMSWQFFQKQLHSIAQSYRSSLYGRNPVVDTNRS